MATNTFSFVSKFPSRLYQVSEDTWTADATLSPLSTWACVDSNRGVYEMLGNPSTCEPHLFVLGDCGLYDMSDEEVGFVRGLIR